MDEEEELEVHFGQPIINPDSPQVSPQPDPEDTIQGGGGLCCGLGVGE